MAKKTLKPDQIRLVQVAVRAAGLRTSAHDGRYRLLLSRYKRSDGQPVASSKDLTNAQLDDLLAICEGLGWRYPGKSETYCRDRARASADTHWATDAQREAIGHLAGDLGWTTENLKGMLRRMTQERADCLTLLTKDDAYAVIEALKAMLSRRDGKPYKTVKDAADAYREESTKS